MEERRERTEIEKARVDAVGWRDEQSRDMGSRRVDVH